MKIRHDPVLTLSMEKNTFNGRRLKEGLQFRGMKMTELADRTGISKQSLSLYANGENTPPYENVAKIAKELDFPFEYFTTEDLCTTATDNTYFRSQATASKMTQNAQKVKLEYVAKVYETLLDYVDFPKRNLPFLAFDNTQVLPETLPEETLTRIEQIADELRKYWNIGMGPIENMQYLLESNGIIITSFKNVDSKIDAFSQRINIRNKGTVFIVALAVGEKPTVRLRFDMAHELGHILMHDWDDSNETLSRDEFKALEQQANMFAGAFLLPREAFGNEIAPYATNVEYYRLLRKKWGVSMQAMMYRARQLEIISANQFQYMMRTVSAKGWRTKEPGDTPGELNLTIFQRAIDILFDGEYLSTEKLMQALAGYGVYLNINDLEDILGLKPETLKSTPRIVPFPSVKLKNDNNG